MISINNVKKYYNKRCILDIPNYNFQEGRSYAILGANGSGKSTLLRIILGMIKPDIGTVFSDEIDDIGYLPQFPYIFDMSVKKNMKLALVSSYKDSLFLKKKEINELIDLNLKLVHLEPLSNANGRTLSGGEKQRLALARVIARPHKVILLDEPTSATDIVGIEVIENVISDYMKKNRCTLIFNTHLPNQAMRLANEVLLLDKGKIIESGSIDEILLHPKSDYAKAFFSYCK